MNLNLKKEKKIGLIILGSALVIAAFLISYNPESFKKSLADIKKEKEAAMQAEKFSIQEENKDIGVLNTEDLSMLLTGKKPPENLTEKFADNLASGFIGSNPEGIIEGQEIKVPDAQVLLNQIANEQIKSIDESLFVIQKDLKISYNNSQENIYNYYESYKEIIAKYSQKMKMGDNLEMFVETINPDYLSLIPGYLQKLIDELKNLTVPSDFSILHQDGINLFISEKTIFNSMLEVDEDPLKAASALMTLEELFKKFNDLDANFIQVLKNHGFQIQYQ